MKNSWTGTAAIGESAPPLDAGLAIAVRRCEPGAFERLIGLYEPSLRRYVHKLLLNHHDAQEVVQDTFVRAHRALTRQYTEERCRELALKPWLFRIARNLALNARRGLRHELEQPLPPIDDNGFRPLSIAPTPGSNLERQQDAARLDAALALLPSDVRELILLRFIEEMSYGEIARATGHNEASLRGRVFRALKMLRDTLAEEEVAHAV